MDEGFSGANPIQGALTGIYRERRNYGELSRRGRMGALSDRVRSMEQACQVSGAYATIPSTSQMETGSDGQYILPFVESVLDVLFLKIWDQTWVNRESTGFP